MKKLFSVILSLVILLGVNANAIEIKNDNNINIVINEYDLIKNISEEYSENFQEYGLDSQQYKDILNYKDIYRKHINELNKLTDNSLKNNGYDDQQISIIRSFTGSEDEMSRIGASVTIKASTSGFKYDGDYTRGTLKYTWSWSGVPVFKTQDMLAVSWNGWDVTSNVGYADYYGINSGNIYTTKAATYTEDGNGTEGAAHKFKMAIEDNYYYAKDGGGTFTVKSDTHAKKDFYYYMEYGHSQITVSGPSFTVGTGGGSGSISFSFGTQAVATAKGSKLL